MKTKSSLWTQSGAFWGGACMIADGLVTMSLSWLPRERLAPWADFAFFSLPGLAITVLGIAALVLAVVWVCYQLGWGD